MWRRNQTHSGSGLEAALRRRRAEAPHAFARDLARRIEGERVVPERAWSRVAFAAAVSVFILGTFASLGGLSYASSGAQGAYIAMKQVVSTHKLKVSVASSSATSQYPHKPSKAPKTFTPPKIVVGGKTTPTTVSGTTLPFTGQSLLGTVLLSLLLICVGIAMRRRERRN